MLCCQLDDGGSVPSRSHLGPPAPHLDLIYFSPGHICMAQVLITSFSGHELVRPGLGGGGGVGRSPLAASDADAEMC